MKRKLTILIIFLAMLIPGLKTFAENHAFVENMPAVVDGEDKGIIKTIHYSYENNRYVSLRDMASALKGTADGFGLSYESELFDIKPGEDYSDKGGERDAFPEGIGFDSPYKTGGLKNTFLAKNGTGLKYHAFLGKNTAGVQDCYVSITDLAMILDSDMAIEDGVLTVVTAGSFHVDMDRIKSEGFFLETDGALVGDITTGEIFSGYHSDVPVAIASTTKLMSALLFYDDLAEGKTSMDSLVTIPEEAERLSKTSDGVIAMTAGETATVKELITGALLPSSNECVLALAMHLEGSEEAFVERMNRKAAEIGLSEGCIFYNCHGLPVFTDTLAATKLQNHMSAEDMFKLVSHLLNVHPQITEITSLKKARLESFEREVKNTNPVLYNMPGCIGLKTGTTNMAGACLVCAAKAEDSAGTEHTVVAVEFGAEDSTVRCTLSEVLLRYGVQCVKGDETQEPVSERALPADAEALIRLVIARAP